MHQSFHTYQIWMWETQIDIYKKIRGWINAYFFHTANLTE